jgi:hypothetical protein
MVVPPAELAEPPATELVTPPAVAPGEQTEAEWVPPPTAVPFGPFLALGALAQFLFGPTLLRLFLGFNA